MELDAIALSYQSRLVAHSLRASMSIGCVGVAPSGDLTKPPRVSVNGRLGFAVLRRGRYDNPNGFDGCALEDFNVWRKPERLFPARRDARDEVEQALSVSVRLRRPDLVKIGPRYPCDQRLRAARRC